MNSNVEHPAATHVRVLLLALVGAAIWVVLSILAPSSSASADDGHDATESLLGSVTATIDSLPVVATVVSPIAAPVNAAVEQVAEPATAVAQQVAPGAMTATVVLIESTTVVVDAVIHPVLEQPIVASAVDLLTDAPDTITGIVAVPGGAEVDDTEPRASVLAVSPVASTADATTGAAVALPNEAQAVGDLVPAAPPAAPAAPTSFDSTAPAQNSAGQTLAAAFWSSTSMAPLAAATTSVQNDALPSSATFETDSSPD